MIVRILLIVLIANFLVNRAINRVHHQIGNRTYRKELRYHVAITLAFLAIAVIGIFVARPGWLQFAQLPVTNLMYWAGNGLLVTGMVIWLWSRKALGSNWSPRIAIHHEHSLVSTGPYSWVRHPIYTSYIIDVMGIMLATGNLMVVLLPIIITSLMIHRTRAEESTLLSHFGGAYWEYCQTTGKFFPKLF